ncbi:MAG TPA: hypothetical protein DDW95_09255 [Alphaproteobacteria bacterium]|nr:hypothetical protein [Alphaproteobacteria bacterium]HBF98724.1 hypothetical protein [Alphaproteobacteria bacterium]
MNDTQFGFSAADWSAAAATYAEIGDRAARVTTPCGEGKMVWRIWGQGEPLVLVHGGAGSWSHWIRNIPAFEGDRMVIAPDLPGLGESAMPPVPYSPESIAEIVADGITELLPDGVCFDMAGFSFGGMISSIVAGILGERVRTETIMGGSGLGGKFGNLKPTVKLPLSGTEEEMYAAHRHNLLAFMIEDPAKLDALALYTQGQNAPRTRIRSPEHATSEKALVALRKATARLNSIWGEFDIIRPYFDHRRDLLAAICPDAEFHVIAGAGHWVQYEAADEVNRLLRRFIA